MKGIGPKYLVLLGCAAGILLTLLLRSQIYDQQRSGPIFSLMPTEKQSEQAAIIVHFHQRRPFYMSDGDKVYGLVVDPIALAFKTAGIPHVWQETPARRQLDIIERNEDESCAAGWFKTPEREAYAKYTLPIYQDKPFVAVARADNEYLAEAETLDRVLQERRLQLLVKEGYSYGHFIDEKLKAFDPRRITTTAENQNILKMIENYRADYSFMTEEEAQDLLTSPEAKAGTFRIVRFFDMPAGGKRYIICSRKVGREIIDRLNAAILTLHPVEEDE
ncbi:MAG TPA: hypothetical protein DDY32_05945 [Desulfobulbaceae bacterium]|nr:hypothetical protein [Desulfobulbaceae bacterium]